ncbi:tyrosine-protein phosphatase [uncultured Victivallis sp.]|uniref:fused DSP-PTPase phosphatase/NAD kinase-like protein n=1 Tax=uncultured Victivallis sp. TaxID=354118 RepID=UPI0025DCA050|nr:tyrosine-protein phosphatase [uncultured Victivallis sp.]
MVTFAKRAWFVVISVLVAAIVLRAGEGELPRNFHEVDPVNGIFRSAQPDHEKFAELEKRGFRTVLNLRNFHSDRGRLKGLKIKECPVPCNAGSMTEEHVYEALRIIRDEPKSLLIHCWHGSDRTGTVVAAYRIVFNGRDVESAIAEMCEEKFGHHATIYGNLPDLLRSIDWEKMRTRLMNEDLFVAPFESGEALRIDVSREPFRVTVNGKSAQDADAALALIREEWAKKPRRIALLVFDWDPGDTLYEPFAMKMNRLPELREATRIDAVPVRTEKDSMPEFCRRFGLEEGIARKVRVIPHRITWPLPGRMADRE